MICDLGMPQSREYQAETPEQHRNKPMNSLKVREAHDNQQVNDHKGDAMRVLILRRLSPGVSKAGLWGRVRIIVVKAADHDI